MLLNEYHEKALDLMPSSELGTTSLLNLAGENLPSTKAQLGAVLWMLAALCDNHGYTLRSVAQANLDYLASNRA
jgi:hypothetical protein